MKRQDWVYLAQLVRALQAEGVEGRRIGEMVAEIEQHLVESGADAVDEFGTPPTLARSLAARPGSRRPGWVPPLWLSQFGASILLLLVLPLLTPDRWGDSTIPVTRDAMAYGVTFYLVVFWFGYSANRKLDGRSWGALGWRFVLTALAVSAVVTLLFNVGNEEPLLLLPKVPYLIFCAAVIPALLLVLMRHNNAVRFPANAQHLNRLKLGLFAGAPPGSDRT